MKYFVSLNQLNGKSQCQSIKILNLQLLRLNCIWFGFMFFVSIVRQNSLQVYWEWQLWTVGVILTLICGSIGFLTVFHLTKGIYCAHGIILKANFVWELGYSEWVNVFWILKNLLMIDERLDFLHTFFWRSYSLW